VPLVLSRTLALIPLALASSLCAQESPAARAGGSVTETLPATTPPAPKPAAPVRIERGAPQVLQVGDVQTLPVAGVVRIALGNGAPARATVVDGREIVLLAEAVGRTSMHVWTRSGRQILFELEVVDRRGGKVLGELAAMLDSIPGLRTRAVGDRLVLEGRYPNREAAARVQELARNFPQLLLLVPMQPVDTDPLQLERMVQFDLRVIEVKRRALEQLGIRWADSAAGPTVATNALGYANTPWRPESTLGFPPVNTANPIRTYIGLATQITSALRFLESRGDAWTLAEPRLSTRSGGEAKFLAGGEIPIPVAQGNGAVSVEYKQYGVRLEFKPLADAEGNIDSALMVEVSEPDARNSNAGFIALTTNRTETQVALKQGEPLVISGLLRQRSERSTDAVPGLGRLPIISALFKSRERTTEQTELFVIATPRVLTPESALNKNGLARAAELSTTTQARTAADLAAPGAPDSATPMPSPTSADDEQRRMQHFQ
jgi:pilus assembly protein CpaC